MACWLAVATECGIGFGKLGQPVRVAVTGGTVSPPIDVTLELLGRERALMRLRSGAFLDRFRHGRVDSARQSCGAIAQLGERLHGMQEVVGSIPTSSTRFSPARRGYQHSAPGPHRLEA